MHDDFISNEMKMWNLKVAVEEGTFRRRSWPVLTQLTNLQASESSKRGNCHVLFSLTFTTIDLLQLCQPLHTKLSLPVVSGNGWT